MAETPPAVDAGESLCFQGNDAFPTKDWERAVDLYQRSVNHGGANAGKTYSNLAATLCKLSRFEEAAVAAEHATTSSPTWAKAWWRRGIVAEQHHTHHRRTSSPSWATETRSIDLVAWTYTSIEAKVRYQSCWMSYLSLWSC
jgi:tetratricopeptide (TPR) repeat protein